MKDTKNSDIDYELAENLAGEICEAFDVFKMRACYNEVKIDPLLVWVTLISWMKDLARHTLFHYSEEADEFKKAGYLIYWLVKIKPISFAATKPPAFQIHSKYLAINEEFATCHALHMLKIRPKDIGDNDLLDRFVYGLYYRDDNAKSLASKVEMLYKMTPTYLQLRLKN